MENTDSIQSQILALIVALFVLFLANAGFSAEQKAGVEIKPIESPWSIPLSKIKDKVGEGIRSKYFGGCPQVSVDRIVKRPEAQMWEFTLQRMLDIKLSQQIPLELYSKSVSHLQLAVESLLSKDSKMPLEFKEQLLALMHEELDDQTQIRMYLNLESKPQIISLAETNTREVLTLSQNSCQ